MKKWKNKLTFGLCLLLVMCMVVATIVPYISRQAFAEGTIPSSTSGTTESTPASSTPDNPEEEEKVTVTLTAVNGSIHDLSGVQITGSVTMEAGTALEFKVTPAQGCQIQTVTANEEPLTADEQEVYRLQVQEDTAISVVCADITEPQITTVTRNTTGWAKEAVYIITASDNLGIVSVSVKDSEGGTIPVTEAAEGYTVTICANGTYTVTVTDEKGLTAQYSFEEDQIDTQTPVMEDISREPDVWSQSAVYTFRVTEEGSGLAEVLLKEDGAADAPLQVGNDGLYRITVAENKTYTVILTDHAGNRTEEAITEAQIDLTLPEILNVTRQETGWSQAATYQFTVQDAHAGILTVTVTKENEVPVTVTPDADGNCRITLTENGVYTISVTDKAGNEAAYAFEEDRVDTQAPSISNPVRTESGWAQEMTYTFTAEDTQSGIQEVTVTPDGGSAVVLTPGTDGSYRFTADANTRYTVKAIDNTGREMTVSVTEDRIDTEKPWIEQVKREHDRWAQSAKYTFLVADAQSGVETVTLTRPGASPEQITPENNGLCRFTVTENGSYTITVTDAVGRTATISITESRIDTAKPEVSAPVRESENWQTEAEYQFTVQDTQSGIKSVSVTFRNEAVTLTMEGQTYRFTAKENGNYTVTVTDNADNVSTLTVTESRVDYTKPVIQSVTPQNTWDAARNTVQILITDDGEIQSVSVADPNGDPCQVSADGAGTYSVTATKNGTYTLTVTDKAGNTSTDTFVVDHIDTESPTAPALHSTANGVWVNTDVTVTASAQDAQSGITAYWYSRSNSPFDKANWEKMDMSQNAGTLLLTQEEDTVFYVVAEDGVGRISAVSEIRVSIDKTAPGGLALEYLKEDGTGYNKTVSGLLVYNDKLTFRAQASDAASGVVRYEYRVAGLSHNIAWTSVDADEAGFQKVIEAADDVYIVYIRAYDLAGNCSAEFTLGGSDPQKAALENTPGGNILNSAVPTVTPSAGEQSYTGAWTKDTVRIRVSGSAAASGIAYYEYRVDHADPGKEDTDWQKVPVTGGEAFVDAATDTNAVYYFRAVTYADNLSYESQCAVRIQKTAPEAAVLTPDAATGTNGWYTCLPEYGIVIPARDLYLAPVTYLIQYSFNGEQQPDILYDGTNAPKVDKDGIWQISITVTDNAGNSSADENSAAEFRVDTKVPDELTVTMDDLDILIKGDKQPEREKVNILDQTAATDYTIFRNHKVTVQASADGGDSGLYQIYYQRLNSAADFRLDGEWTKLLEDGLSLTPDSKNHLYFKAVDVAGNTTYFSGESILLDASAPAGTDGSDLTILPQNGNLSVHSFYYDDATVLIRVAEPEKPGSVFAGLKTISYRVLKDGTVTQEGQLYPGTGNAAKKEGRILSWDGQIVIDSALNDSNHIVVEIVAEDMAGNTTKTVTADGKIKIDITKPVATGAYDRNDITVLFEEKAYFTGQRILTVQAAERNFIAAESVILITDTDTGKTVAYEWKETKTGHEAVLAISEDGHYTVSAVIVDAAGNKTETILFAEGTQAATAFVIDNTAPKITVSFDNNNAKNEKYFDAVRTATVTVLERNFDTEKVEAAIRVELAKGGIKDIRFDQWKHDGNEHTAFVYCSEDGNYSLTVTGTDALGNESEPVTFNGTAPQSWVIDTIIHNPAFTGVSDHSAHAGTVVPGFTVLDPNLDSITFRLLRTLRGEIGKDITEEIMDQYVLTDISGGKTAALDIFPEEQAYDGIYTLTATVTDKAGNTAENTVTFSVNRFGSVYAYGQYLADINGSYRHDVGEDLVITEFNPSRLVAGSAKVYITRNGTVIAQPEFTVTPVLDGTESTGESGWYEYRYVISKENFTADGVYEVVVATEDAAGNVPENTDQNIRIRFSVDNAAPELPSIVGMEDDIVKADSVSVRLNALDNVELASVVVYLNGTELRRWDDLSNYGAELSFDIPAGYEQQIRLVVTDKAGNVLDTADGTFAPGYTFHDTITVSTNFFLRYYANKPLFYGTVTAVAVAAITAVILLILRKRKKEQ